MKDKETELLETWERERAMYGAWGNLVATIVTEEVSKEIHPTSVELFVRIPAKPRTKENISLLAKAFHRGKPYVDPYNEIEDKVGVRFVVLLSEETRIVERALLAYPQWLATKARDFEDERAQKPFEFDYQSLHYIVRNKSPIKHGELEIAANTPCEVQIRSLLQHAYSELTHDTIYKPSVRAEPDVKRAAAKGMALIEATDDYFMLVRQKLDLALAPSQRVSAVAEQMYRELTGLTPDPSPLNVLMVDHFKKWAREGFEQELAQFIKERPYLAENIRERAPNALLFRQPAILLAYWVIKKAPNSASAEGPLTDSELGPLYGDLGIAQPVVRH